MLDKKTIGTLNNIIIKCERIKEILANITEEEFYKNIDKIELVSFNLLQIGEIVGQLDESFYRKYNEIPWKQIKAMRNRIAHGYDSVNIDIVWNTSKNNCPELKDYCIEILKNDK